jgi:hypothetical protein
MLSIHLEYPFVKNNKFDQCLYVIPEVHFGLFWFADPLELVEHKQYQRSQSIFFAKTKALRLDVLIGQT